MRGLPLHEWQAMMRDKQRAAGAAVLPFKTKAERIQEIETKIDEAIGRMLANWEREERAAWDAEREKA